MFGAFNRGKKGFKNYTLQPRIHWAGWINCEYILYFLSCHLQTDFMLAFFQIRGGFRSFFLYSLAMLASFLFLCLLHYPILYYYILIGVY